MERFNPPSQPSDLAGLLLPEGNAGWQDGAADPWLSRPFLSATGPVARWYGCPRRRPHHQRYALHLPRKGIIEHSLGETLAWTSQTGRDIPSELSRYLVQSSHFIPVCCSRPMAGGLGRTNPRDPNCASPYVWQSASRVRERERSDRLSLVEIVAGGQPVCTSGCPCRQKGYHPAPMPTSPCIMTELAVRQSAQLASRPSTPWASPKMTQPRRRVLSPQRGQEAHP
jgi:hypothetical protein